MTSVLRRLYRLLGLLPASVRGWLGARLSPAYRMGATVIATDGDRVLLARHAYRPGWAPPGGMAKRGELPEATVRRELTEELGVTLDLGEVVWRLDPNRRLLVAVYPATLSVGSPAPEPVSAEILEARWFPWTDLPEHDELAAWILEPFVP